MSAPLVPLRPPLPGGDRARDGGDDGGPLPVAVAVTGPVHEAAANDERSPVAETRFRLGGLHCAACALTISEALEAVDGVVEVSVNAASEAASVRFDPTRTEASALVAAVERAGYIAVPDTAAAARGLRRQESRALLWRWFVAGFIAMQVMMFATPSYVSGPGDLAPDLAALLQRGIWMLTLPVLLFSATPFFRGAWRTLRRGRVGMDVPVALGIGAAFVAGTAATFDPSGPLGDTSYLDSLSMFIAFLLGGRWLEMRMRHRAEELLEQSCERLPDEVMRLDAQGRPETITLDALRAGDRLLVPAGQAFAADGRVLEGETEADEALLTGESAPVAKAAGDAVVAGSVNLVGPVTVLVERVGADTRYEAIVALMRAARARRPALLAAADRWARPFLLGVILLALVAGAAWSVIDPSRAVGVVIAVLVVTCPCAISLAAPSALLAAAGAMSRRGLLPRRLDAIEALASFRTLFVDKTGTLTESRLALAEVRRAGDAEGDAEGDATARAAAAALARRSRHPVSQALADLVPADAPAMPMASVREVPGKGIEGIDESGAHWRLGIEDWNRPAARVPSAVSGASGVSAESSESSESSESAHTTPVDAPRARASLSRDGQVLLRFAFDERLRPGALAAVRALQADGVKVHLLSGDGEASARRVALALGLDAVDARQSPEAKLATMEAAQARGESVAMLGDGINDAPVLGRADLAVAMGEGAAVARTQADLVLVSNRLGDLVDARAHARRTLRVVKENLAWAAIYNAACVPLALSGHLPPWAAGLGMATSSVLVIANSMRLARLPRAAAGTTPFDDDLQEDLRPTPA